MRTLALLAAATVLAAPSAPLTAPEAAPVPVERSLYSDAPNGMFLLAQDWSTRPDPGDVGLKQGWQREGDDDGFKPVAVPNAFNAGDLSRRSFAGSVQWYRTTFTPPAVEGLVAWRIRFESVNVDATVWLNGVKLGHHRGAYLPFELPARSIRPGTNELVVRVDSRGRPGDLPPANRDRGWWNYGGILREVYLRAVRSFDLTNLQVVAPAGKPARVRVTASVSNETVSRLPLVVGLTVTGPGGFAYATRQDEGALAGGARRTIALALTVPRPQLWSPADPALYELTIDLPGGQRVTAHFGIRSWSVRHGRLELNGRPIVLRGASFHEQTPAHGAALTPGDVAQLVRELRSVGANFAREHYPPDPALLEAFDRAGIVFWEQIPVWRVGGAQLRRPSFRRTALDALRGAILRDRNHAAVVAWSVSNETLRGGRGEVAYLRAARSLVKRLDNTRLLAADQSLRPLNDLPPWYRLLDAIGLNDYVGWYGGRTSELPGDLALVRHRFRRQAVVITEFGAEANRSGPPTEKGTYAFQARYLRAHLRVFDRLPWLSGALVWVLRDFAVRPGWTGGNPHPRPPILFKGLFTQSGKPKPAAATVKRSFARALGR